MGELDWKTIDEVADSAGRCVAYTDRAEVFDGCLLRTYQRDAETGEFRIVAEHHIDERSES